MPPPSPAQPAGDHPASPPSLQSPLLALFSDPDRDLAPTFLPWGPPSAPIDIVETFGEPALEYASIRKAAAILDLPQRGVLELTGPDRLSFLDRMLTQLLRDLPEGRWRPSFWLSRQGRIEADLRVINLEGRTLIDLDRHLAPAVAASLDRFIITEEVTLRDRSAEFHALALHGPAAPALLASLSEPSGADLITTLPQGGAAIIRLSGQRAVLLRADETGSPGLHLIIARDAALPLWQALAAAPNAPRPAGWAAFNIARIEAGTPLFCVDFGPTNLPHESGVLRDRVSLTKGCYLGQEVVARMEARKQFKASLAALRLNPSCRAPSGDWPEPRSGASVFPGGAPGVDAAATAAPTPAPTAVPEPKPIGAVTSSAPSPMLGGEPVCFAMLRQSYLAPGTALLIEADSGAPVPATVQLALRTLPQPG